MKKRKDKLKVQRFRSSNSFYGIEKREDSNIIKVYGLCATSFYDFAETVYNDCVKTLNFPTPLICEVSFYNSRAMVYTFQITNCQSIEDVLKELSKQLRL